VVGFGAIIMVISAGIVMVRVFTAKLARPELRAGAQDAERDQVLEGLQVRLGGLRQRVGELEERVDFTERLLAGRARSSVDEPPVAAARRRGASHDRGKPRTIPALSGFD
jgi:hypothetical protein